MPTIITDVARLQQYISGVMERARHHAPGVNEICLAIAGAIIWRKEGDIEVFERDGDLKNVLWFHNGGRRFAVSYNHNTGQIEVRRGTTQGAPMDSFDNTTPLSRVKLFFENL